MYSERKPIREIAEAFGCNRKTIYKTLERIGVKKRKPKNKTIKNTKFGNWTALSNANEKGVCLAKCECGAKRNVQASALLKGTSTQCAECSYAKKIAYVSGSIRSAYWRNIKSAAEIRGIDFQIDPELAWDMYQSQKGKCALSGLEIKFGGFKNQTASLDRIDSSKGYSKNNIQWVHKTVNAMKSNLDEKVFISFCKAIAKEQK